jgi:hypothetical protein
MMLGGCGTTVHWDNVEKLGMLGLGAVGGANATTPLQTASADIVTMTAQNQIYHDQQMQVAQAGRSETNVNIYGNDYNIPASNAQQTAAVPVVQQRSVNAYKTRDLNGNGVGEFLEELIPANGDFSENDLITVRASNRHLPGTAVKLRIETLDEKRGWLIIEETPYVQLPANEEQYWGYPARNMGTGNKRATIYEPRIGEEDVLLGATYFHVGGSSVSANTLSGSTISSVDARKHTL